jgi:undecaprenyl-diphosphatase
VAKSSTRRGAWIASAAFIAFSWVVAQGWLYKVDSTVLWTLHDHSLFLLDVALSIFSLLGSVEVAGVMLLVLLTTLFLHGRQALAGRLLVVFVSIQTLALVMKLYWPQIPIPEEGARQPFFEVFTISDLVTSNYPYPSGHMMRGVIVLGALYLLSKSRLQRAGVILALIGLAAARIYFGVHWASDVVGGALLGTAALLWAFDGKRDLKPSRETVCEHELSG